MEPKLTGITADDLYLLAQWRVSWPELTEQFVAQEQKMRKANNLVNPGMYRPPWTLE